jgi:hypothetical protein
MKQLKLGTRVRLTNERILPLDSNSAKRFRERVGTVIGYRAGAKGPLVLKAHFAADGGRQPSTLELTIRCRYAKTQRRL